MQKTNYCFLKYYIIKLIVYIFCALSNLIYFIIDIIFIIIIIICHIFDQSEKYFIFLEVLEMALSSTLKKETIIDSVHICNTGAHGNLIVNKLSPVVISHL